MTASTERYRMMAVFLLEIAIVRPDIYLKFSREEIVRAIVVLAKGKFSNHISPELIVLSKQLKKAK